MATNDEVEDPRSKEQKWIDHVRKTNMQTVTTFFGILFFVGLTTLIGFNWVYDRCLILGPTLWAFAMLMGGTFFGFLFGYPRTQKSEAQAAGQNPDNKN